MKITCAACGIITEINSEEEAHDRRWYKINEQYICPNCDFVQVETKSGRGRRTEETK